MLLAENGTENNNKIRLDKISIFRILPRKTTQPFPFYNSHFTIKHCAHRGNKRFFIFVIYYKRKTDEAEDALSSRDK